MPPIRLNPTVVRKLEPPGSGYIIVRDTLLQGFGVRVTESGVKSFIAEKRVSSPGKRSRVRRVTLGKFPTITVDRARELALRELAAMSEGIDPVETRAAHVFSTKTLQSAFDDYLAYKAGSRRPLKDSTLKGYAKARKRYFKDWMGKPVAAISRRMVEKRHRFITNGNGGAAQADQACKYLQAVFNWALKEYVDDYDRPLLALNPVEILTHGDQWNRVAARQTSIAESSLPDWYRGVEALRTQQLSYGPVWADYFLLLLFAGLRLSEGVSLQWVDVDFDSRVFAVRNTKNHLDHLLPMSDFVEDLLRQRRADCADDAVYVFPSRESATGHLVNPYKPKKFIVEHSGVVFTPHDLRRTGATFLALLGYDRDVIKKSLNHKVSRRDVTDGYINWTEIKVQVLRKPVQDLADFLTRGMGIAERGAVIQFRR